MLLSEEFPLHYRCRRCQYESTRTEHNEDGYGTNDFSSYHIGANRGNNAITTIHVAQRSAKLTIFALPCVNNKNMYNYSYTLKSTGKMRIQ